jgi:hypothetical protein
MMKNLIIKIVFIAALFSINQPAFSQQNTDGKFLFKMWFFVEHVNQHSRKEDDFPVKDSSLFSLFEAAINIKCDTLKSNGFTSNYTFLSVAPLKNNSSRNDSALTYSKTTQLLYASVPVNNCEGYVLCVNTISGRSYRLQGFYGNDFFSFLQEVKEEYQKTFSKSLSTKSFLKNYYVEGMDFNCINKGLSSGEVYPKKYPCLKKCSDFIITIH